MSTSNSGCGPGGLERRRPTNLSKFSSLSLILFSRRPRLLCSLHILWDISRHILAGETNIIDTSIRNCYFYSLNTRSPYLCDLDYIKPPSFLQTHHVQLGAIYFDSRVNHVWLQSWYWKKFQRGTVASAQQQTRDLQKKRLTDTLSLVSGLTLLA